MVAINSYSQFSLNPIEVIYRGQTRAEKENDAQYKQRDAEAAKIALQNGIQKALNRCLKNIDVSPAEKHSKSFSSRIVDWLYGSDRTARLLQMKTQAFHMNHQAKDIGWDLAYVEQLQKMYKEKTAEFLEAANDAYNHDIFSKCGWTWWR